MNQQLSSISWNPQTISVALFFILSLLFSLSLEKIAMLLRFPGLLLLKFFLFGLLQIQQCCVFLTTKTLCQFVSTSMHPRVGKPIYLFVCSGDKPIDDSQWAIPITQSVFHEALKSVLLFVLNSFHLISNSFSNQICIVYSLHRVLIHSHLSYSYLIFLHQHSLPLFLSSFCSAFHVFFSVAPGFCYPISLQISYFSSATWMFLWIFVSTKLSFLHLHHQKLSTPLQLLVPYFPAPS